MVIVIINNNNNNPSDMNSRQQNSKNGDTGNEGMKRTEMQMRQRMARVGMRRSGRLEMELIKERK